MFLHVDLVRAVKPQPHATSALSNPTPLLSGTFSLPSSTHCSATFQCIDEYIEGVFDRVQPVSSLNVFVLKVDLML